MVRASPFSVRTWICCTVAVISWLFGRTMSTSACGRDPRVVLRGEQEVGLDVHRAGLLDGGDGGVGRHEGALRRRRSASTWPALVAVMTRVLSSLTSWVRLSLLTRPCARSRSQGGGLDLEQRLAGGDLVADVHVLLR